MWPNSTLALMWEYNLERDDKWYEHQPPSVMGNERAKILWFNVQCDNVIQARRPDLIFIEKEGRQC